MGVLGVLGMVVLATQLGAWQNLVDGRVAKRRRDDRGALVECTARHERRAELVVGREVALVDEDDVGGLGLQQQFDHAPVHRTRIHHIDVSACQVLALAQSTEPCRAGSVGIAGATRSTETPPRPGCSAR